MITPNEATPQHFLPFVQKQFRVAGGRHAVTLVDVDRRTLQEWEKEAVPREPFNLIFRGPPGDILPEGHYTFEVDGRPTFEFYIMPIYTTARDRQNYQAVFT